MWDGKHLNLTTWTYIKQVVDKLLVWCKDEILFKKNTGVEKTIYFDYMLLFNHMFIE